MAFDPITAALSLGSTLIDRLIPDRTQAAAAKAQLLDLQVKGELDNALAQLQVDTAEAANKSIFVAGWRPAVGWVCSAAFGYAFVVQPLLQFTLIIFHAHFDPAQLPKLDLNTMLPVLLGMLGLGAMRSYDKTQGTDNGH
jgi:hypothetical protein